MKSNLQSPQQEAWLAKECLQSNSRELAPRKHFELGPLASRDRRAPPAFGISHYARSLLRKTCASACPPQPKEIRRGRSRAGEKVKSDRRVQRWFCSQRSPQLLPRAAHSAWSPRAGSCLRAPALYVDLCRVSLSTTCPEAVASLPHATSAQERSHRSTTGLGGEGTWSLSQASFTFGRSLDTLLQFALSPGCHAGTFRVLCLAFQRQGLSQLLSFVHVFQHHR